MSNSHCHLQLGARGAVSPPVGPGQGPGGGPGGKAKILCLLFLEGNYASLPVLFNTYEETCFS